MAGPLHPDHQDLLQFLYQFPVGVIEMTEAGQVEVINPAAARLLSTELVGEESVSDPLPVLRRLVPPLIDKLTADVTQLGMISTGRGEDIDSRDGVGRFTVAAHRVRRDKIIITLTDITEERRLLIEQRSRAQRLQRALLGRVDHSDLELGVAYRPAHQQDLSGGDWYDVISVGGGQYALVVGDVVGHDIEASATMGQLRAIVRAFALVDADPSSVLARTDAIARTIDGAGYATINYVLLDQPAGTVTYASAGHPPPLIVRADGSPELLTDGRRPVLAVVGEDEYPTETVRIGPGDLLVMYTDGLIERRAEIIDDGLDRLVSAAVATRSLPSIDAVVEQLTAEMLAGTDHTDDVCVLAVRNGRAGTTRHGGAANEGSDTSRVDPDRAATDDG